MIGDIKAFHEKFGLDYNAGPRWLPQELEDFRRQFMQEELDEYIAADTLEGKLDALVDLVYVALGTAYMSGFNFQEAWRRVHEANMAKVRGESGRSSYDVVKPEGWQPPYLGDLVEPEVMVVEHLSKPYIRGE